MDIPTELFTLFSAQIEQHDGNFVIEVPRGEVDTGDVQGCETYRVALLPGLANGDRDDATVSDSDSRPAQSDPPVEEGERRTVEIESIGDQGDGITRVERGFVVIVSDTSLGEEVTVEITNVRENVAFADVVDRPGDIEKKG
ncbi:TRAM domain-containing protein [Haloarcula sediminis]|uniref:TRAM domain-containing protein n=1 Tax=Haloarcula sediminis TaxID=3111777 RepID=UPI002D781BFC|nr:TRAM domain-containing protein [Haloarcula sp. CK38]